MMSAEDNILFDLSVIDQNRLQDVYGESAGNWGDLKIFQGNFINYGYWKDVPFVKGKITLRQRIQSSLNLYLHAAKYLNISSPDHVLEIGCGRGVGACHLYDQYCPAKFVAIDITTAQISRANRLKRLSSRTREGLSFENVSGEATSYPSNAFNKIYSIEAIQHIGDLERFANEMRRMLQDDGRLVIAGYIPTGQASSKQLAKHLPLIHDSLENPMPIEDVRQIFLNVGFRQFDIHSIGEHVFQGYHYWAEQVSAENPFTYNYLYAFLRGYLDYYLLVTY
ncbi:MAG: class I SAM-dependent methyltransferase [Gammaproteobacteria bacterium]